MHDQGQFPRLDLHYTDALIRVFATSTKLSWLGKHTNIYILYNIYTRTMFYPPPADG